jgi:hypothetical protein
MTRSFSLFGPGLVPGLGKPAMSKHKRIDNSCTICYNIVHGRKV